MMALGILNVMVPCVWLYLRYSWNEVHFSSAMITFDRLLAIWYVATANTILHYTSLVMYFILSPRYLWWRLPNVIASDKMVVDYHQHFWIWYHLVSLHSVHTQVILISLISHDIMPKTGLFRNVINSWADLHGFFTLAPTCVKLGVWFLGYSQ